MCFVSPLDEQLLHHILKKHKTVFTIEDGVIKGGFGSSILEFATEYNYKNKIKIFGIHNHFIEHGSIFKLQQKLGLDGENLAQLIRFYS